MDIGSLTGKVTLEDQLSEQVVLMAEKVKHFAEEFEGAMGAMAIGTGVLVAGIAAAVTSIVELGNEGSKIIGVTDAFDRLSSSAGTTGDVLRENLSEGVKGTITELGLMESTTRLLGSGMKLTGEQALLMGEAARALGKATGTDAAHGLDVLSGALTTGRTRALSMQGIIVDVKAGEEQFAASLGVTVDQLNAAGQLEGKRIAILDATRAYVERLGVSELTFAERIRQGNVAVAEWGESLAKAVASSTDVNDALKAISEAISTAFGATNKSLMDAIIDSINWFARLVTASVPYIVSFVDALKALIPVFQGIGVGLLVFAAGQVALVAYSTAVQIATTLTTLFSAEAGTMGLAMTAALGPVGILAAAIGALYAAWKFSQTGTGKDIKETLESYLMIGNAISKAATAQGFLVAADKAHQEALKDSVAIMREMRDAAGNNIKPIQDMADSVMILSQNGTLTTSVLKSYAEQIKSSHIEASQLPPVLKAIVEWNDRVTTSAKESAAEYLKNNDAFKKAVESMVAALEGESKKTLVSAAAIEAVINSGNKDIEVKARVVDAIDGLIAKHVQLAGVVTDYYTENEALGKRSIAMQALIEAGYDNLYSIQAKSQGDSLEVMDAQAQRWYNKQYRGMQDLADKGADVSKLKLIIDLQYGAMLEENSNKRADHEAVVAAKIAQTWDSYYGIVDKMEGDSLGSQLNAVSRWYDAQYTIIAAAAKKDADVWSELEPLNAELWARMTKTQVDFINAANLKIMESRRALDDFTIQQTNTATEYEVQKIWSLVAQQQQADLASGRYSQEVVDNRVKLAQAQTDALYIDNKAMVANSIATLQEIADRNQTTYEQMLADPDNYSKETIKRFKDIADGSQAVANGVIHAFVGVQTALGSLANDFTQIAQISGATFGEVAKNIGLAVKGAEDFSKAMGLASDVASGATGGGWNAANIASFSASLVGFATAMYSVGAAIISSMEASEAASISLHYLDVASEHFGATLSKSLATALEQTSKDIANMKLSAEDLAKLDLSKFGAGTVQNQGPRPSPQGYTDIEREMAEALNLSTILKDLGPVSQLTASQLQTVEDRFGQLFELLKLGGSVGATALKELDATFQTFTADIGTSGFIDKGATDLLKMAEAAGTLTDSMQKFLGQQATNAATDFSASLKVTSDAMDAVAKGTNLTADQLKTYNGIIDATAVRTQSAASSMALVLVASFRTMVASGTSFSTAIKTIQPGIDSLDAQMQRFGLSGGAAFDLLKAEVGLASDSIAGPALDSVNSLTDGLVAMSNMGLLDQQTFMDLSSQVGVTFDSLVAQGKDGNAILHAMQDPLQKLWEAEQQFGYKTDDATQALIDQALANGEIGPGMQSTQDQLLKVMKDIRDMIADITGKGKTFADTLGQAADATRLKFTDLGGAMNNLPTSHSFTVTQHTVYDNAEGAPPVAMSGGGIVPAYYGQGTSNVVQFKPRGTDTVPAMLTPGEQVTPAGGETEAEKALRAEIKALRADMSRRDATMPMTLARAVRDEVQKVGNRRVK